MPSFCSWEEHSRLVKVNTPTSGPEFTTPCIFAATCNAGIDAGLLSVEAEFCNSNADKLATAAVSLHDLPAEVIRDAKQRIRLAVTLHTTAVNIFDQRSKTIPLPHRQEGYSDSALSKKDPHPNYRVGQANLQAPGPMPLSDADLDLLLDFQDHVGPAM